MNAFLQLLLLPLRRWQQRPVMLVAGLLLVAVFLMSQLLKTWDAFSRAALVLSSAAVLALLAMLWMGCVAGLLQQNTRQTARLVPGHLRRLRLLMAGAWLLLALPACLLIGWAFSWPWPATLAAASAVALLATTVRFPWLWIVLWVPLTFSGRWADLPAVRSAWASMRDAAVEQPVTALLLTALLGLLLVPGLLTSQGRPRPSGRAAADGWTGQARDQQLPEQLPEPLLAFARGVRQLMMGMYRWQLDRLCAQPPGPPMARALLLLTRSHWTGQATAAVVLVLVGGTVLATLHAFLGVFPWPGFERSQLLGPAIGLMVFALNPLLHAAGHLAARREQALLLLVPGLPRGPAFSRALALRLSLHFGVAWALGAALAIILVGGDDRPGRIVQAVAFGTLPFMALFWRDWSRLPPQSGPRVLVLLFSLIGSVLLLGWLLQRTQSPWPLTAALSLGLTAALLRWRWQRLGQLPAAWPAGRYAAG